MKDLIKGIEEALQDTEKLYRNTSEVYNGYLKSHYRGKTEAYMSILEILRDYNLITAPKQIKLSEILTRLKEEQTDYEFRYKEGSISVWKNRWCYAVLDIEDDTRKLYFAIHDSYLFPKWLYTLWIAGTKIIDDLKELEKCII